MSSKRQSICTAIDAALKGILVANGYRTDLGKHVYEWRTTPLEEGELPGINWRDRGNSYSGPVIGRTANELKVEVEIYFTGSTAPARMREYIADIRQCLMGNNTWVNLATETSIEDDTSEIQQADRKIGGTSINFTVKYNTSSADF